MTDIAASLESLGFSTTWYVKERTSIADLVPKKGRTGIYVLWFENGEFYVGKTEDITRRFLDHHRNFGDLVRVSFQKTAKRDLDQIEDRVIGELELRKRPLRNIAKTSFPKAGSDFEEVMSPEEQDEWLADPTILLDTGDRTNDPDIRRKYETRFAKYLEQPFAEQTTMVLQKYVERCIPCPIRSEMSFWGLTCLPSFGKQNPKVYARININWQEVLAVSLEDGGLVFYWQVARSPLEEDFGEVPEGVWGRHPDIEYSPDGYQPGGQDQCSLRNHSPELAIKMLEDDDLTRAMRVINLRLMNKGPCVYGKYHCFALADQLIGKTDNG